MARLRRGLRVSVFVAVLVVASLAPAAATHAAQLVISTPGPMTNIYLSDRLFCQLQMAGDAGQVFYGGTNLGACATYLQLNSPSGVFGPNVGAGGVSATDYTPVSQTLTGTGTAGDPYVATTTVDAIVGAASVARLTNVDTYVVGQDKYDSTITLTNPSATASITGRLYHAGDCSLVTDTGYGSVDASTGAPQCAVNPNNTPAGRIMSFIPVNTPNSSYIEGDVNGGFGTVWTDITSGTAYPNTIAGATNVDNGMGISWPYSVSAGQSQTYAFQTRVSPNPAVAPSSSSPLAVCSNTGQFPVHVSAPNGGGTLNLISDGVMQPPIIPDSSGNATITVAPGVPTIEYWASDVLGTQESPHHIQTVGVPCLPSASAASSSAVGTSVATFTATVNPHGLATTAHFEYGLDAQYRTPSSTAVVYDLSSPEQPGGSDFAAHTISDTVTGLVPNALYHFRLVATNSAGTVDGPDQTFKTPASTAPSTPVISKTFNAVPLSGLVLIKLPAGQHSAGDAISKGAAFIPLTEVRQLPSGTQVDARLGGLKLIAAAAADQHIGKIQSLTLSGALFKIGAQNNSGIQKGLLTLTLQEDVFPGSPSYATCAAHAAGDPLARPAISPGALQTLHASDRHGRFRTRGRYSASTVRGTNWDTIDRCDGTLTVVRRGTVDVFDFGTRTTITVHAGHDYLAKATTHTH
ncbi:MAG: hypothetical protein ACYDHH_16395 [Solirubrobacteraceae bacterium]